MNNKSIEFDVKPVLEQQFPYLKKLLEGEDFPWVSVNRIFNEKHLSAREKHKEGQLVETNFFSLVSAFIKGEEGSFAMFDFYKTTFEQLYNRLNKKERKLSIKIIKRILKEHDNKYLNFIGELATLNAYMSTGDFDLLNIEEKIPRSEKSIDFLLRRKKDGAKFLVEVVNIHIEQHEGKTIAGTIDFIESKFHEKYNDKFLGNTLYNLTIQPVIWTNSEEQIKMLEQLFIEHTNYVKDIRIPMCYLTYRDANGQYEHRFEYVTTILKN